MTFCGRSHFYVTDPSVNFNKLYGFGVVHRVALAKFFAEYVVMMFSVADPGQQTRPAVNVIVGSRS